MAERAAACGVRLVGIDFQAKPAGEFTLSPEEALAVSTEAFPRTLSLAARAGGGFRSLKLFPAAGCIGVSHVFDGGVVDAWDRPVLSARVALLSPGPRNGWGRDLAATGALLAGLESELAGSRASSAALAEALAEQSVLGARERWAGALQRSGLPPAFVARLAHLCSVCRDVLLITPDTPQARLALTLALALVPPSPLSGLRLCTTCGDPDADSREEVVFLAQSPGKARRGLWARLSGRVGPEDRAEVRLAEGAAPEADSACKTQTFQAALSELLEADAWPEVTFAEMHRHLLLCLGALLARRQRRFLEDAASALPKSASERLAAFVRGVAK